VANAAVANASYTQSSAIDPCLVSIKTRSAYCGDVSSLIGATETNKIADSIKQIVMFSFKRHWTFWHYTRTMKKGDA